MLRLIGGVRVIVAWRVNYLLRRRIVPVPIVVAVVVGLSVVDFWRVVRRLLRIVDLWRVVRSLLRIMNIRSSHICRLLNNMLNVRRLLNDVMFNVARMFNNLVLRMLYNMVHDVLLRHIVVRFVCSVEVIVLMHLLPLLLLAVERRVVAVLVRLKLVHPAGSL